MMIATKRLQATKCVFLSMALFLGAKLVPAIHPSLIAEAVVRSLGYVALVYGAMALAQAKGYNKAIGLFCGLSIIGLVILLGLRDKTLENEQ